MTLRVAVPATCTNTPEHNFSSGQHLTACPLDPFVHACMPASRLIPDCLFMFPRPESHVMWMGITSVWTPVKRPFLMTSISDTGGYSMELEILVNGCILHTRARTWRHWWTEQADEDVSLWLEKQGVVFRPGNPPENLKIKRGPALELTFTLWACAGDSCPSLGVSGLRRVWVFGVALLLRVNIVTKCVFETIRKQGGWL
jgi:hypothetical protein